MDGGDRISRPARLALLAPAVLVIAVCLAGPLTLLLSYSFAPGGSTRANFSEGLTLENYVGVLGDGRLTAIRLIVLPLGMPGLLAGATLVFCVAISSYVTPALMGPSGAKYSATLVYQQFVSVFDWPRGAAIAAILLVITAAAL